MPNVKELLAIIETYKQAQTKGKRAALATVVGISGSAYRRPGAKMLVLEDESTVGSVSGGCLERAVIENCLLAIQTGQFMMLNYDTSHDDDAILGSGSGCAGSVQIFVEALLPDKNQNPLLVLQERLNSELEFALTKESSEPNADSQKPGPKVGREFVLGTVIQADYSTLATCGTRFVIEQTIDSPPGARASGEQLRCTAHLQSRPQKTISPSENDPQTLPDSLMDAISLDSAAVFSRRKPLTRRYELGDQKLQIFLELITPAPQLLIFGAGQDAPALAELADSVGMRVSVFDHRKAFAERSRFPFAEAVTHYRPEEASIYTEISPNCFCIVMAHNFLVDKTVLANLLPSASRYVGVLGPKLRTEKILQQLHDEGINLSSAQLTKLHAPVGLDIGAENSQQIALAIIAEIQAVANHRQAGFLRDRKLPIHDPESQSTSSSNSLKKEIRCQTSP